MDARLLGALAACVATLAVFLGTLTALVELPTPFEFAMIAGGLVLLASAGGLIGAAVAGQSKSGVEVE